MATTTPTPWRELGRVTPGAAGPTGLDQQRSTSVQLASGDFFVIYAERAEPLDPYDFGDVDIYGRLFAPDGHALGDPIALNTLRMFSVETLPQAVPLSDGGFHLLYYSQNEDKAGIFWERYDSFGQFVGSGAVETSGIEGPNPGTIASFADDSFVVAYSHPSGPSEASARAVLFDEYGSRLRDVRLEEGPPSDVAVLSDDRFVVLLVHRFEDFEGMGFKIFDKAGDLLEDVKVTEKWSLRAEPDLTLLSDDRFLVSWPTNPAEPALIGQIFDKSGAALSKRLEIGTLNDTHDAPAIAPLQDGGFVVIYEADTADGGLLGQRFDAAGEKVGQAFMLAEGQLASQQHAGLLADGRVLVTWTNRDDSDDWDVRGTIIDPRDAVVVGTDGDDLLFARHEPTTIFGLSGDDKLYGLDASDKLYGGSGRDIVYGRKGDDWIVDDDGLNGDSYDGGRGRDTIDFSANDFSNEVTIDLRAEGAVDPWGGSDVFDNVQDAIAGGEASLLGDFQDNHLLADEGAGNEIFGRKGDDRLEGKGGDDGLFGGDGDDRLVGRDGEDSLNGRIGQDVLRGGGEADVLLGSNGLDTLMGNGGLDVAKGGAGDDTLYGGKGNDRLRGQREDDLLYGGKHQDRLFGEEGEDTAHGDEGRDSLFGDQGDDLLYGGQGDDLIRGREGDDVLFGGSGQDFMKGDAARDSLFGGSGDDTFWVARQGEIQSGETYDGGEGSDTLALAGGVTLPTDLLVTNVEVILYG